MKIRFLSLGLSLLGLICCFVESVTAITVGPQITCEVQFSTTNGVPITSDPCGNADAGVSVGTPVQVSVNVCNAAGSGQLVDGCSYTISLDGAFFGFCSFPAVVLAPGQCTNVCAFTTQICTNAGVHTFIATANCIATASQPVGQAAHQTGRNAFQADGGVVPLASIGPSTSCTNTLECCAAPPAITCDVQFFTNNVQVTTNACGTAGDAGVAAGTEVTVTVEVCADAANSGSVSNLHYEVTLDGNFFFGCSPFSLNPGDCATPCTLSTLVCSNAGVHAFAATVTGSDGAATTCSNTLECCAQHISCNVQFFTNDVLVTTNTCGTGAVAGVTTGTTVSVRLEVCADAGNGGSISNFSFEVTEDGNFLSSGFTSTVNLGPGECSTIANITGPFCTNAAVHTFAATVTASGDTATACTNTLQCCAPAPPARKCPRTVGYWKNHPSAWPVTSLTLGCQTYTQAELLSILSTPTGSGPKADASLILADQLIAAKLNIANGSDPAPVAATIADADNLLCGFSGKLPYKVRTKSSDGKAMVRDANVLNSYNNAQLTPNCTR